MKDVVIKYNPYKVSSTITVSGEEPRQNSQLKQFLDQRLQMWVDKIPRLLADEYNDDKFTITFYGTELDYQDLLSSVNDEENNDLQFTLKKMPAKEFGDKEDDIREVFEKVQQLPFPELQSDAIKDAFEKAFNEELDVNVVATMSAGKSTLINALIGKKLMPSKNGACTATITKIQDDDDNTFKAVALDKNGTEIAHYSILEYKNMMLLNKNEQVSEILVKGNIPFVTSDEVSLVLIDTPGPDNARDQKHGLVTARALDQSSKMLVMFVMNGGKLHDEAQDAFLKKIAKSMNVEGKQAKERFLFVINKMDSYDEEDDDIANETIPETIEYLESIGIREPNVFPAAAEPALLIRRYMNSHDEEEKNSIYEKLEPIAKKMIRQDQLHLEKYPKLASSCKEIIDIELAETINKNDIIGQALIHSGIRGIEETIRMYVTKYCRPAKITNVVSTFQGGIKSAEAFENTKKEISTYSENREKLENEINLLTEKLTSKKENEAFKAKIKKLDMTSKLEAETISLCAYLESRLTNFWVDSVEQMEKEYAMARVRDFSKLALDIQNEFNVTANKLIDEDIKDKSQQLLNEYIKRINAISNEFDINGLEIDLASFVQGELTVIDSDKIPDKSIKTEIETQEEERTRVVTRRARGFERLFSISRWFAPEYEVEENYIVSVEYEVTFVSREELSNTLISPIRKNLYNERENVIKYSKKETKMVREYFYDKFDTVDAILAEKTRELSNAVSSKEQAEISLKKANELLEQINEVNADLEQILEI